MVSIIGGGIIIFIIAVCIACVCRAARRKLRKDEAVRRASLKEEKKVP
jgi:hypothetical protein